LVEPGRGQGRRDLLTEPRGCAPDRADVGEVRPVAVELRLLGAPLDPYDEEHDDEDRQCDEADQAKEGGEIARWPEAGAPASPPALRRSLRLEPLRLLPRGRLFLVEEVEIQDVVVARTHAAASGTLDEA